MSIREFVELVLKFEDLRENYNLNYIIYTKVFNETKTYHEVYNVQNISQLGYLLTEVEEHNYNVEINISRLDGTWNDTATLESWWQITDKNGNQLTSSRTYLTTPLGEENFVALVEAESALIAGLAQEISQSLSRLAK